MTEPDGCSSPFVHSSFLPGPAVSLSCGSALFRRAHSPSNYSNWPEVTTEYELWKKSNLSHDLRKGFKTLPWTSCRRFCKRVGQKNLKPRGLERNPSVSKAVHLGEIDTCGPGWGFREPSGLRPVDTRTSRLVVNMYAVTKLCLTLSDPMNCGLLCPWDFPGKNTGVGCHFLLQGVFLTQGWSIHLLLGRQILYHWATREAQTRGGHIKLCPLLGNQPLCWAPDCPHKGPVAPQDGLRLPTTQRSQEGHAIM